MDLVLSTSGTSVCGMLIDKNISLPETEGVGEPFANADMTKVFNIVTGVDTQRSGESK